jgi:hypothetical protein
MQQSGQNWVQIEEHCKFNVGGGLHSTEIKFFHSKNSIQEEHLLHTSDRFNSRRTDHEYVVLLLLEWIFTELLTEMSKPEVEKKTHYQKSNKWALLEE